MPPFPVCFSPDGKPTAVDFPDDTVRLWDMATGRQLDEPLDMGGSPALSVCFSPDGRLLASGSFDGTVRLWDAATGKLLDVMASDEGLVESISLSARDIRVAHLKDGLVTVATYTSVALSQMPSPDTRIDGHGLDHCGSRRKSDEKRVACSRVTIVPLHGIDMSGLDFTKTIVDERTREILRKNRAKA